MISFPICAEAGGVYLPEQDLWLDPLRKRPHAVISHAHSDHVAPHPNAYMTLATRQLVTHRRPWDGDLRALDYEVPYSLGNARLTLYPAGHVLGSAQALVETDFGRVLYTGDLKLRAGRTAVPAARVTADVLVLESTFGKPRYVFPDSAEVVADLTAWCLKSLADGCTPVLLGYSLGKGQELLSALDGAGLSIGLHPVLHAVTNVYQELGVGFPPYQRLDGQLSSSCVVICPPAARQRVTASLSRVRTAAVTGWAMDSSCKDRLNVDAVFPLSDHADFAELCAYAESVQPAITYTVLGFDDELAFQLRRRGLRAQPLRAAQQLSLW
jgi:DNA ligase-1